MSKIQVVPKQHHTFVGHDGSIVHMDPAGQPRARKPWVCPEDVGKLVEAGFIEKPAEDVVIPEPSEAVKVDAAGRYEDPGDLPPAAPTVNKGGRPPKVVPGL